MLVGRPGRTLRGHVGAEFEYVEAGQADEVGGDRDGETVELAARGAEDDGAPAASGPVGEHPEVGHDAGGDHGGDVLVGWSATEISPASKRAPMAPIAGPSMSM